MEALSAGRMRLIMGGFHLLDGPNRMIMRVNNRFKELGVECVGAGHCTGDDAAKIFKESYEENFIAIKVGQTAQV